MLKAILLLIALLAGSFQALGGEIPKPYRGLYAASGLNLEIELKEDKIYWRQNGQNEKLLVWREPSAKLFQRLAQGKSGVYIEEPPKGAALLRCFAVVTKSNRSEPFAGFSWQPARVAYFQLQKDLTAPAGELELTLSDDGLITLDEAGAAWQIGWGPKAGHFVATKMALPK
jgi:hypothetical protein